MPIISTFVAMVFLLVMIGIPLTTQEYKMKKFEVMKIFEGTTTVIRATTLRKYIKNT